MRILPVFSQCQWGESQPQLWREVRERWKWQTLLATAIASGLVQFGLWSSLTHPPSPRAHFDLFHTLAWIDLLALLVVGTHLLVRNLVREAKLGTLVLLRLSPQPAGRILLGKLLGVPLLLYWAIALAVPLQVWSAWAAGIDLWSVLVLYGLAAIASGFIYCFTLVYSLRWGPKAQPWYVLLPASVLFLFLMGGELAWAYATEASLAVLVGGSVGHIGTGCIAIPWLWSQAKQSFQQPPDSPC